MKKSLFSILIVLILSSCIKHAQDRGTTNPCDKSGTHVSIDERMTGFFFTPGSFWVYRNDSLNLYDSVVIYKTSSSCVEVTYTGPGIGSEIDSYYCAYYLEYPSGEQYFDAILAKVMYRNYLPSSIESNPEWLLYSVGMPDSNYIDTLQVGLHTFYKCYESHSKGELNPDNVIVYTALDIGIVKKIIIGNPNQVWNLVRWKIIK